MVAAAGYCRLLFAEMTGHVSQGFAYIPQRSAKVSDGGGRAIGSRLLGGTAVLLSRVHLAEDGDHNDRRRNDQARPNQQKMPIELGRLSQRLKGHNVGDDTACKHHEPNRHGGAEQKGDHQNPDLYNLFPTV